MSRLDQEKRMRAEHRILLLAYMFNQYLGCNLPNHVAAYYEKTPDYKPYENERDQLIQNQLIIPDGGMGGDNRVVAVGLTNRGLKIVKKLLASCPDDKPELTFVRKLRPYSLLNVKTRSEEVEKFFKILVLLYADWFFRKGNAPAFVEEMANDIAKGSDSLEGRMARKLAVLYYDVVTKDMWWKMGDEKLERLVTDVVGAFNLLKRVAYLSYVWRLYGFNRLAYHTVVRHAAFRESGWLYRIYTHVMAAMVGYALFTIIQTLNLLPFETIATITLGWVGLFIALTAAEDLPKQPRIRKTLARMVNSIRISRLNRLICHILVRLKARLPRFGTTESHVTTDVERREN